jgi:predicted membrane chloride channel (bestrophin family)
MRRNEREGWSLREVFASVFSKGAPLRASGYLIGYTTVLTASYEHLQARAARALDASVASSRIPDGVNPESLAALRASAPPSTGTNLLGGPAGGADWVGDASTAVLDRATEVAFHVQEHANLMTASTSFVSTALFLMLSFRVNRASARWWEGRTVFGRVHAHVRSLSQSSMCYVREPRGATAEGATAEGATADSRGRAAGASATPSGDLPETALNPNTGGGAPANCVPLATEVAAWACAYARCLEYQVRQRDAETYEAALAPLLGPASAARVAAAGGRVDDAPLQQYRRCEAVSERLTFLLGRMFDDGSVKGIRALVAMQDTVERLNECGADIARIQRTAEPWSYQKHMRFTIQVWLSMLPLALMPWLHWATVPTAGAIGFVVFKLDSIALELQNPFGFDYSDLPLCLMTDEAQMGVEAMLLEYARASEDVS